MCIHIHYINIPTTADATITTYMLVSSGWNNNNTQLFWTKWLSCECCAESPKYLIVSGWVALRVCCSNIRRPLIVAPLRLCRRPEANRLGQVSRYRTHNIRTGPTVTCIMMANKRFPSPRKWNMAMKRVKGYIYMVGRRTLTPSQWDSQIGCMWMDSIF